MLRPGVKPAVIILFSDLISILKIILDPVSNATNDSRVWRSPCIWGPLVVWWLIMSHDSCHIRLLSTLYLLFFFTHFTSNFMFMPLHYWFIYFLFCTFFFYSSSCYCPFLFLFFFLSSNVPNLIEKQSYKW